MSRVSRFHPQPRRHGTFALLLLLLDGLALSTRVETVWRVFGRGFLGCR